MCSCDCLDREVGPDAPLRSLPTRPILCLCDRSRERRGSAMATLTAPLPSGRFRREPRGGTGPAPLREIQAGKAALPSGLLRHPPRSAAEERPGVTPSSKAGPGLRGGIVRHPWTGPNRVTSLIPSPGYPLISRPDEEHLGKPRAEGSRPHGHRPESQAGTAIRYPGTAEVKGERDWEGCPGRAVAEHCALWGRKTKVDEKTIKHD